MGCSWGIALLARRPNQLYEKTDASRADIQDFVMITESCFLDIPHFHRISSYSRLASNLLLFRPNSYLAPALGFGKKCRIRQSSGAFAGALGLYRSPWRGGRHWITRPALFFRLVVSILFHEAFWLFAHSCSWMLNAS